MAPDSVPNAFVIHSDMEIGYANPTFCSLVGVDSQEQLIGTPLTDLVTDQYYTPLREQVTRLQNGDAPAHGLTVEFQTGTEQPQRVIAVSSVLEWDGRQQVQTSVFPIARPETPGAHVLSDQAMDDAPFGVTIADAFQPDNPLVYVNDEFCELTGYSRDDVLGQNCRFLQGEATREEPVAQMREAIDAEASVSVQLRNYRKDGSMFWNHVTIVPIRADDGTVTHYLGYQQDISAEKRYEKDLSLFKEQADGSEKAILITDPEGTIQYVNPEFERTTGYTAAEATGRNPRILKSGTQDEAFYAELWEQITAGEVWDAELTNQTKQGELYEVEQKIIPVTDEDGKITYFVGIEEDVTEQVLMTQTLAVLNRVLRHNLRNSLNAIDGHAELLESSELDSEARQASLSAIRDQAASMKNIAEKTADIRTIWDPGEANETWDELDIAPLIDTYQQRYPDAEITASTDGNERIQLRNAALFKKAMDEAIENAITHNDQPSPVVTITVEHDPEVQRLRIRVADNGPGIPEVERQVIESGVETPLSHSLGIELWLIEWITTSLGGELTIDDNKPQGVSSPFTCRSVRSHL